MNAKSAGAHGEIDNNHVGLVRAVETEAFGESSCLGDLLDARILEQLPYALQHDRMVVDDENPTHESSPTNSRTRAFFSLPT
jgi:hypothetical protein